MKRKLCTAVLTILMLFALMPTVFAGNSGTCGDNLTWKLDGGVLTISGTGAMDDYLRCYAPWNTQIDGFVDTTITKVVIGNGVTSIGNNAFFYCSKLARIEIPDSVTSIGDNAFCSCTSLTSINIPDSVTHIGSNAFYGCSNLTSIDLSEGLTSISDYTFHTCSKLTSVAIPDGVTSIGKYAFRYCTNLTSVKLPNRLTTIGDHAFEFCGLTSIKFPEGLTTIGDNAFMSCCGLTSIKLPDSVTSLGRYAFYGCTSLNSIKLSDGMTSIAESTFYECSNLVSVEFPDNLTSIGESAFYKCSTLSSIIIPDSVTSIGKSAFCQCENLVSAALPEGLTSIGNSAFRECSLSSIELPEGLTSIGKFAFSYCNSLTSIKVPSSITNIEAWAFYNSLNIADVYYNGTKAQWDTIAIDDGNECLTGATIHFGQEHTHHWDSGKVTTKATCTTDGVKTYTCSGCGETKTETIAATGHNWGSGKVTKAPAALASGVKTYTCSGCGETKTAKLEALANPFHDLVLNSSYYDPVLWAVGKNITKGTSAIEFSPTDECTRGQIVTFLWRYDGEPEPKNTKSSFVDVTDPEASYYKAVLWAVEKGITNGIDKTHFCPTEPCTRAQIVTFLWRYAEEPQPSNQKHNFEDLANPSSYYDAVLWAVEKGITTGADKTHFNPIATCTRAQGMTFLYRYHNTK